jgi:Transglycosylase-like domain
LGALAALALVASSASALSVNSTIDQCQASGVTSSEQFRQFSAKVWSPRAWERGEPAPSAIRAQRLAFACGEEELRQIWRSDRARYFEHRRKMVFRQRITPHYGCTTLGGCRWWALPAYIVDCESGGDYTPSGGLAFGGAYGLLTSTWHQYGGSRWASQASSAPVRAQDIVASRVWDAVGAGAWSCA